MKREPMSPDFVPMPLRWLAACGALACLLAVAVGAWAAHGAPELQARQRLETAALYLFLHGLALALFAPQRGGRLALASLVLWLLGCIGFCGSLIAAAIWNTGTSLAPFGGSAFMLGWVLRALVLLRAR